ncbi:MAG: thioredoxin domain-containing protein [Desulfobacteraceae bacterium]|nr:thioredoxin domain-containing protein [Desulfobacteraceae bacterium]MBC2749000.1 thioredoxin domain-containing protein [Desulfobacteraceae bacterium]
MKNEKKIKAYPFPVYFWPAFILSVGGFADSIYLSISHYRVYTDIGYSSFCAISKSINCDTVSQSPYSILLGVPVPVWGVLGYLVFLLMLVNAKGEWHRQKNGWAVLQLIALFFSLYSVVLAFISTYYVHSYCIMCILSYGINLLLLFYIWIIRKRFYLPSLCIGLRQDILLLWRNSITRWSAGLIFSMMLVAIIAFPSYWQYSAELPLGTLATGITDDGHPWIGASHPKLEITEYTDYLCFQCRKMHRYLRRLVARYPDDIRIVHRHFPMDHAINPLVKEPFHNGSGKMAILALYANEQGKFWQVNDILFEKGSKREEVDLRELALQTGVDLSGMRKALSERTDLQMLLAKDIWAGMKLDITGTPAYVIEGNVYLAQIPPEIIRKVIH